MFTNTVVGGAFFARKNFQKVFSNMRYRESKVHEECYVCTVFVKIFWSSVT